MLTLPPPPHPPPSSTSHMAQDPYRPPPQGPYDHMYGPPPPGQAPYPPPGHPGHQGGPQAFAQPAPRQRTAIACRYCRRRKIRCHGFDLSPDGRCTNCARFHQECIFTPVSSQAHAFVPAHTAYPHLRQSGGRGAPDGRQIYGQSGPPVYGAHGQPLGPVSQPPSHGHDGYAHPSPHAPPPSYGHSPYGHYDDRGPPPAGPPHAPDTARGGPPPARRGSTNAYEYPDPQHMAPVSPATTSSYASGPYPSTSQQSSPYYHSNPPRRSSPPSTSYSYDSRASTSPHNPSASTAYPYGGLHPPQSLPSAGSYDATRTPPPNSARETNGTAANGSRPGMSVRDMLGPSDGGRSNTDSDMLKALNRRGM